MSFDSQALEKAAQALREIGQSPHAQQAMSLQSKELDTRKEEAKVRLKQKEIQKVEKEQEERRKTMEKNLELQKENSRYRDKLERKRKEDEMEQQLLYQEKAQKKQEEALLREEKIKRETFDHQLKMEEKKLKIKGQIDADMYRKNHDLHQQELVLRESERRETLKQIFKLNFEQIGNGFEHLMNNKSLIFNFFLYTAAVSSAYYLSKSSINLGMKFIESRFNKPSLIRETSRLNYQQFYKVPLKMFNGITNNVELKQSKIFENIILDSDLKQKLQTISHSLLNKKKHYAPLRNVLFYGSPGTGKTLFAKQLAHSSGLDFAIMTGADISPLGDQGVHELNKVFDWADTNSNGMILFIDEADAFFRKRDTNQISENLRNAINAFLYRTGTPSKKVMVVLATNQPEQLDKAVQDRMDSVLNFDLPKQAERMDLLYLYFSKYCDPKERITQHLLDLWKQPSLLFTKKAIIKFDESITEEFMNEIADKTSGFSAREIEKFVIACHDNAFSQQNPIINQELILQTLDSSVKQHDQRNQWLNMEQVQ